MSAEIRIYAKCDNNYCKAIEIEEVDSFYIKDNDFVIVLGITDKILRFNLDIYRIEIK